MNDQTFQPGIAEQQPGMAKSQPGMATRDRYRD